jgi:protein O-GlcNAcase / histone acetyltransferase
MVDSLAMVPAPGDGSPLLTGVIEGFYGAAWSRRERLELFDWLAAWGLNTYFYAPKDDLHHRALWREPYGEAEAVALGELIRACEARGLHFVYGLSPGLDIRYASEGDGARLRARFDELFRLGCRHVALLFDDIPDRLDPADLDRWGSLAAAQAHVANEVFAWVRSRHPGALLLFCPTAYCGRMAAGGLGGPGYLETIGRELRRDAEIFWTGPEIVSREITRAHVGEVGACLRRKPLLWDNLHANDYDGRRFFCGPYAGRAPGIREAIAGVLTNPNNEFPLDYVPIRTLAQFMTAGDAWDPRAAYLEALDEWAARFETVSGPMAFDDLVLLGDCYYLPYEEGPEAETLFAALRELLAREPVTWSDEDAARGQHAVARLRGICGRVADLRDRALFQALSRRTWELREEMDLIERYIAAKRRDPVAQVQSDFHRPGTYRGGMVARLQHLLRLSPDGLVAPVMGAHQARAGGRSGEP